MQAILEKRSHLAIALAAGAVFALALGLRQAQPLFISALNSQTARRARHRAVESMKQIEQFRPRGEIRLPRLADRVVVGIPGFASSSLAAAIVTHVEGRR